MFKVYGLAKIVGSETIDEVKTKGGSFFNFTVTNEDSFPPYTKHRHRATLWVPEEDLGKWRQQLKPKEMFNVEGGGWIMKEYEGGKYPIPILKLDRFIFIPLAHSLEVKKEK